MNVMPKVYRSTVVAKEMLKLAANQNKTLTPMQLIKLVYLAHCWMLALYSRPLIEEPIEAWKYGPVIPELYQGIKHYGSNPVKEIKDVLDCFDGLDSEDNPVKEVNRHEEEFDPDSKDIINQVYEKYSYLSGIELSMITHTKNSPWEVTWDSSNKIISNDLITYYYRQLISNE